MSIIRILQTNLAWINELPEALTNWEIEQKFRRLSLLWILTLFIIGIFFWGNFLNWGNTALDFEDWGVINLPRLEFFSEALRTNRLPLHMVYPAFDGQEQPLHRLTDRYFAMPDVITTPQILLLKFINISQFVFIDILIHYTIATIGLLWFRQKYKLSLLSYGFLFLIFNFNGYIQSHYAVGQMTWAGYFLFPVFVALLIQFAEGQQNWIWVSKISFLLCYMVFAGSEHHFAWALIFLGVFALVSWDNIKWIIIAGLSAGLLSAARLLPPVFTVLQLNQKGGSNLFIGYPTVLDVFRSLSILATPAERNFVPSGLSWLSHWEFDIYVGLIGSAFIIYFGIFSWLKNARRYPALRSLFMPTFVIFILTIGHLFALVRELHIPFLDGERVPSRMIGLPLAVFILIAVIYFQSWLDQKQKTSSLVIVVSSMLLLIGSDLWRHADLWNLEAVRDTFGPAQMALTGSFVSDHIDPSYSITIIIGILISICTGFFLLLRSWQELHLKPKS